MLEKLLLRSRTGAGIVRRAVGLAATMRIKVNIGAGYKPEAYT